YIFSLALADLLVIIICVPLASLVYTLESWPWGSALCRITECAKDISIGVSVFTLTALSAERYCAIVNPLRKLQTKPLTVITALFIWLLAIICATPSAIMSEAVTVILNNTTNQTIITCTPFGPEGPTSRTYARYNVVAKSIAY
ncbi:neuropeptide CCHamide-2 receptor-like, partial [Sitodiplosis mosellana]|uniref:neuropeptide CCHamide-2 receptor-like n=1 Tax=Sitodiplosis mosellana TaxID=263140 RepID=UPI00244439AA